MVKRSRKGGGLKRKVVRKAQKKAAQAVAQRALKKATGSSSSSSFSFFPVLQSLLKPSQLSKSLGGVSSKFWKRYQSFRAPTSKLPPSKAAMAAQRALYRKQYASQLAKIPQVAKPTAGVAKHVYSIPGKLQVVPKSLQSLQSNLIKTHTGLQQAQKALGALSALGVMGTKGGSLYSKRRKRKRKRRKRRHK